MSIPLAMSPEREAEIAQREAAARESERRGRVAHYQQQLTRTRGKRYADCSLENFTYYGTDEQQAMQRKTVDAIQVYCRDLQENITDSQGVFLFGPCGTGKDHLAAFVARVFIQVTAEPVRWVCGAELYQQLRDSFDGKKSEGEVLRPYASTPLLWISDPLPVKGELSAFEAGALYRLIESRYSNRRPTLMTANLGPNEADKQFGPAVARRLRETTLQLYCNWPSYRRN
jgi:DNA replication protein DnaC